jgi:hypothetical protein
MRIIETSFIALSNVIPTDPPPVLPVVAYPDLTHHTILVRFRLQRDGVRRLIGGRLYVAVEVGCGHRRRYCSPKDPF